MSIIIDNIDMQEIEAEKYWSWPKSYKGDSKKETRDFIMSGNYLGAEKKDGHYCRLIKSMDGTIRMQGRTKGVSGEYLDKHEWVPQMNDFFTWLPAGTVLLGELYFPKQRGSRKVTTILGCLKNKAIERQEKGEKLSFYIFDVWAIKGESYLSKTIEQRVKTLNSIKEDWNIFPKNTSHNYIDFAKYLKGEELWEELNTILSSGGEGIVITRIGSKPEPGKRTARKTLKVKMEIEQHLDVFLDGNYKRPTIEYGGKELATWTYWLNVKTNQKYNDIMYQEYLNGEPIIPVTKAFYNNWAAAVSISVMKDGQPFHVGWISGITDEMKAGIVNTPEKYKNLVYEVTAMEIEKINGTYSLRHGKFVQSRPDKSYLDCEFSQLE